MSVRVAIIGHGNMGKAWARVCRANPRCEVVSVVDPAGGEGVTHASLYDAQSLGVALVIVATPTDQHHRVPVDAFPDCRHMLVEKPIARSVGDAEYLIGECGRDVALWVGHVERWNPAFVALQSLIASGVLGPIRSVDTTRVGPNVPAWASVDAHVVQDLAVHDFDLLRLLLGPLTVVDANIERGQSLGAVGAEIRLASKRGPSAHVRVSWTSAAKKRTVQVRCERAWAVADLIEQAVNVYDAIAGQPCFTPRTIAVEHAEPLALQLEELLDVCEGQPPRRLCSAEDGLAAVRLVERAVPRVEWA